MWAPTGKEGQTLPTPMICKRERRAILTSETEKVDFIFAWFDVSLPLDSSLLKIKRKKAHLLFSFQTSFTSGGIVFNADTKFQSECALSIWHWVEKYFLGLPWSWWVKRLQTQQVFPWRLPGKPRGNKITSQSLSMTMAGRYWYTREKWATLREIRRACRGEKKWGRHIAWERIHRKTRSGIESDGWLDLLSIFGAFYTRMNNYTK